ncbi:MAG: hypothetical protein ABJE10_24455 [bacterium]
MPFRTTPIEEVPRLIVVGVGTSEVYVAALNLHWTPAQAFTENELAPPTSGIVAVYVVPTIPHPKPTVLSKPLNEEVTSAPFSVIVALMADDAQTSMVIAMLGDVTWVPVPGDTVTEGGMRSPSASGVLWTIGSMIGASVTFADAWAIATPVGDAATRHAIVARLADTRRTAGLHREWRLLRTVASRAGDKNVNAAIRIVVAMATNSDATAEGTTIGGILGQRETCSPPKHRLYRPVRLPNSLW